MENSREREPLEVGMFRVRNMNEMLGEASRQPVPRDFFEKLWYEGELSCLFADSNLGKSILAVQIAEAVARTGTQVLYFDFEMNNRQFLNRYSSGEGKPHNFPETMRRVEINPLMITGDYAYNVMNDVERVIEESGARVVIVDNLTWLCSASENGEDAAALMQRLMAMKFKYGLSMLVIAHTPKRDMTRPITANDLAGSKKLFNFFDSVFALGRSALDTSMRYIKQVKCRNGEFTYDSENVRLCYITANDEGTMTLFELGGTDSESRHLKERSDNEKAVMAQRVKDYADKGLSHRQIAQHLGISKSTVSRIVNSQAQY